MPARRKDPSTRLGHRSAPKRGVALDPLPLPHGLSRARTATRRDWDALFTSGLWSRFTDSQRAAAERWIRLVDELNRETSPSMRLKLAKEVRLQARALAIDERLEPPTLPADDRRSLRAADPSDPSSWDADEDRVELELAPLFVEGGDYSTREGRAAVLARMHSRKLTTRTTI